MARPMQETLQEVKAFIDANPGLFNGVAPGNVIAHLGTVHPNLWNQLDAAYREQGGDSFANTAKGALMGSVVPGIGTAIGAGTGAVMDLTGAGAPTLNEWALANPSFGQALIGQAPPPAPVAPKKQEGPTDQQLQDQRLADYQKKVDDLFNKYDQSAIDTYNREQGKQRGNTIAERIAIGGNVNDPANQYAVDSFENTRSQGLSSLLGQLSGQRASGQMDLTKTIENIRNTNAENEKNRQLDRDTLTANINNAAENRGLSRYLQDAQARNVRDAGGSNELDKWLGRTEKLTNIGTGLFGKGASGGLFF